MSIMRNAASSIQMLFPAANFREQRSILLDIGKGAYCILSELNQEATLEDDDEQVGIKISIDIYKPLLDVEWIKT
ncbi:hypothetical protein HQN90_29995 [Paenibacillus alba]|uniref:hypothetical protein n=1 Tax=Paenibacillus alba TaxID=1197127 RepID=UPI001565AFF2|nr:hypothetical protein [Paenibacillus alba]NQX70379.1 hypothetical protein [Paenibacillus alba]